MQHQPVDQMLSELSNKTWRKRGTWYHTTLFAEIFADGESTAYAEKLGLPFKKSYFVWGAGGDCVDLKEEWDEVKRVIEAGYASEPDYLKSYSDHCLAQADKLVAHCTEVKSRDVSALSSQEVADLYAGVVEEIKRFIPFMFSLHVIDEILTERFSTELAQYIKERSLSQADYFDYQTALTFPYRKILVLEEQESLSAIALKIKKEGLPIADPSIESLLQAHTDKYSWINAYGFERLPYSLSDFKARLDALLKTDVEADCLLKQEAETRLREQQAECMEAISDYPELVKLSQTIQVFGFLRSYRVDVTCYSFFMVWNLIEGIANRLSVPPIDLQYLDSPEIIAGLTGDSAHHNLIKERRGGSTSVGTGTARYEYVGADVEKIAAVVSPPVEKSDGTVKGTVAYPGKVTARCKVLSSLDDMERVEVGDVLVIAMTDPNYIPAMNRAAAFITDQGGILCHAAIVSREMKKPCIIGTKNATKILKDGDLVEVDAERGVVRIIERK